MRRTRMNKRTAVALIVLVLVLGGGLAALQRSGRVRIPDGTARAMEPAAATEPAAARPTTPAAAPELAAEADHDSGLIDGNVIDGMTHEGIRDAVLTFVG